MATEKTKKPKEKPEGFVGLSDWLNAINKGSKLELTEDNEKYYNPFIINRALGNHQDTVLIADEVNRMRNITKQMAFDFYKHFVPKTRKSRYSQWVREYTPSDKDAMIVEYFNISLTKARNYVKMINLMPNADAIWSDLASKLDKGGVSK